MSKEVTHEQVRDALIRLMNKVAASTKTFTGTIESVDEDNYTCVVKPSDGGAVYRKVRLKPIIDNGADGLITIPNIGSHVLVGRITNPNDCFIIMFGEVKKYIIKTTDGTIELNGDKYDMVKAQVLKTELNKTNQIVKTIQQLFKSFVPPGSPDGGVAAYAFLSALKAAITPLTIGDFSEIQNENVKHG